MKNVLLIGLGRFGRHMAMDLNRLGHQVMAVDLNEERINDILPYVTNAQIGDSTNEQFIRSLGVNNYDLCIVAIGNNFQSSLETTSLLKDVQAKFLLRNGADNVVYPEKQVAEWAAIRFTADHILDFIEVDDLHAICEVEVPKSWYGKTVGQVDVRRKYNLNIIGIKKNNNIDMAISSETLLNNDVTLLVLGDYKSLQKCFQI